jgi:hypothetical protein
MPPNARNGPLPAILWITAVLLLGAASSIGVSLWASRYARNLSPSITDEKSVAPSGNRWSTRVWIGTMRDACNVSFAGTAPGAAELSLPSVTVLPHSAWREGIRSVAASPGLTSAFWNMQAYGWPRRCLMGGFAKRTPGTQVNLGWWKSSAPWPTRFLWPGLILNSLLFGAAWIALLLPAAFLFRTAHARLRLRRGHCPFCNYDLRRVHTKPCLECGRESSHRVTKALRTP